VAAGLTASEVRTSPSAATSNPLQTTLHHCSAVIAAASMLQ
jgi:hypothetical protein